MKGPPSPSPLSFSPLYALPHTNFTQLQNLREASKICSHTHTHLREETDKSEPLKPRHAQSEEIQKSESSESAAQSQHRSQQRAYLLLTKASELKSELKLCSKRLLCSTSLKLLFKLKGVDWLRAMTTESPHHSHKFASSKPHPAREREREGERGRERGSHPAERETLKFSLNNNRGGVRKLLVSGSPIAFK